MNIVKSVALMLDGYYIFFVSSIMDKPVAEWSNIDLIALVVFALLTISLVLPSLLKVREL